jgi:hypothetical protein
VGDRSYDILSVLVTRLKEDRIFQGTGHFSLCRGLIGITGTITQAGRLAARLPSTQISFFTHKDIILDFWFSSHACNHRCLGSFYNHFPTDFVFLR